MTQPHIAEPHIGEPVPDGPQQPDLDVDDSAVADEHSGAYGEDRAQRPWYLDEPSAPSDADLRIGEPPPLLEEELAGLSAVEDPLGVFGPRRVLPLEDEASPLITRYLFATERFRGEWRRHWSDPMLAAALSGWASGQALRPIDPRLLHLPAEVQGIPTSDMLTWLLIAIAALGAWRALSWPWWRMVLTNKRIMLVRGMLWQRTSTIPLERLTNVRSSRSPLAALFGYGTLSLSAGRWQSYRIRHVPHLNYVMLLTMEEAFEPAAVEARLSGDPVAEDGT